MPSGGVVKLRFAVSPHEIVTELEDTGKGIPPQIASRLFRAFATYGKANGTGLGLSICKKIVQDHRGVISASNVPNGGALFRFTLPSSSNGQVLLRQSKSVASHRSRGGRVARATHAADCHEPHPFVIRASGQSNCRKLVIKHPASVVSKESGGEFA